MTFIINFIDDGDPFSLLCLAAILAFVGAKMASSESSIRQWGWRMAAGSYVMFGVYAGYTLKPTSASDLVQIAFRGLLAAGIALGVTWIILPIVAFVVGPLLNFGRDRLTASKREAKRRKEEEFRHVSLEEAQRRQAQEDADRQARERQAATQKTADGRRRDDARMRCMTLYDRYGPALADQFPRERLQEHFELYMSDASPTEVVEQRAMAIMGLINDWVEQHKSGQKKRFVALAEIAADFQAKRDEVPGLPYDDDVKDSLLTNINKEEDNAIERSVVPNFVTSASLP